MARKIFAFLLIHCYVFSFNSDILQKLFSSNNKSFIKLNLVELCHIALLVFNLVMIVTIATFY